MAGVYMLRGSSGRYYIGSATVLPRQLDQHRHAHPHSTRRLGKTLDLAASLELATLDVFFNVAATIEIYTLPLHAALPISALQVPYSSYYSRQLFLGWSQVQILLGPPFFM